MTSIDTQGRVTVCYQRANVKQQIVEFFPFDTDAPAWLEGKTNMSEIQLTARTALPQNPTKKEATPYGTRYETKMTMVGKHGKTASVFAG